MKQSKEKNRISVRKHYHRHKEYYTARNKVRKTSRREFVNSLKISGCSRCPEKHVACLEFHHLDPSQKDITLSMSATNGWSFERIEKEAAKCILLCANCHRKEHYEQRHPDIA